MAKVEGRDKNIDGLRGLACISVVLIHTLSYTMRTLIPPYIQGTSLLIDVPLFFYITGRSTVLSKVAGWNFSGIWRLLKLYYLLLVPLWIAQCIYMRHLNFKSLLLWSVHDYVNSMPFPVFMGSMWFIKIYGLCIPAAQRMKNSPRAAKSAWVASLVVLLVLGFPRGGLLAGTRFAFDPAAYFRDPPFGGQHSMLSVLSAFGQHSVLSVLSVFGIVLLGIVWSCIFYSSFILFGMLHQQGELKRWIWGIAVLVSVVTLAAYRFSGDGWVGGMQSNKFPPNMIYWSYSMLSTSLIIFAVKYFGFFRSFLASWIPQWIGKNALYAYFAQGFSASLLFVYVAHTNGMPLGIRIAIAFLINLGADMLLVWFFLFAERRRRKLGVARLPLGYSEGDAPPMHAA